MDTGNFGSRMRYRNTFVPCGSKNNFYILHTTIAIVPLLVEKLIPDQVESER